MKLQRLWFACLASFLSVTTGAFADRLSVPGTGDGIEILRALAAAYSETQPAAGAQAGIDIPASTGSGGGIAAVADGRAVLGRVARPLTASEASAGIAVVPLMRIPAVVFVHPSVEVRNLTYAQLSGIYSGAITNWREVGGGDMRIRVVRRESEDSTLKVLRATMPGWQDLTLTPRSKIAVSTQEAVQAVEENEGAIGFGPSSSAMHGGAAVVQVEGMDPLSASYPSAVTVSLIFKQNALPVEADAFLKFVASPTARAVISRGGALPWVN
jgi:phosphate transport system substrate-binding protein